MNKQVKDALIQELGLKNITGVIFAEQGKKVMLIIDKEYLSNTNKSILNAINVTYPDIIVSIKDPSKPFDYEELYEQNLKKVNKKVLPYLLYSYHLSNKNTITETYFDDFRFTGIELDTEKISNRVTPLGYFLEFINALQEQDVIGYENMVSQDADSIKRHNHYVKEGQPDMNFIDLWVIHNEELIKSSEMMNISKDPYAISPYQIRLNKGGTMEKGILVKLSLDRVNQNVLNYLNKRKQQGGEENPGGNSSVVR